MDENVFREIFCSWKFFLAIFRRFLAKKALKKAIFLATSARGEGGPVRRTPLPKSPMLDGFFCYCEVEKYQIQFIQIIISVLEYSFSDAEVGCTLIQNASVPFPDRLAIMAANFRLGA